MPEKLRYSGRTNRKLKQFKSEFSIQWMRSNRSRSVGFETRMELKPGDRVIFSYQNQVEPVRVDNAILVPYDTIYAKIDNGRLVGLNGYVLIEMVQQELVDTSSGFKIERKDRNKYGYGVVRVIGSSVQHYADYDRGDYDIVREGDLVVFDKKAPRLEVDEHNTLTKNQSSLFRIQRKDILWCTMY